jgi:small subunit ribosomal protein S17e
LGSVRTEAIKKLAKALLETHHEKFSADYEANKKSVDILVDSKSKHVRNQVAGYVTRLRVIENQKASGELGETTLTPEEEDEREQDSPS